MWPGAMGLKNRMEKVFSDDDDRIVVEGMKTGCWRPWLAVRIGLPATMTHWAIF